MATASDVLSVGKSYLGVKESPANSNNVLFNTAYYGKEVNGSIYPWCCSFMWYIFTKANAGHLFYDGKKTALCATLGNWFKEKKRFYTSNPQPGDICFMHFDGGSKNWTNHVGIVSEVKNGSIITIEGNTSTGNNCNGGMVMERTRKIPSASVVGFGRPAYSKAATPILPSYPCKGIDVSGYQVNLPYSALRNGGVKFAILKIIRKDLNKDKQFDTHYKGFTEAGIPVVAVYNYSYATTTAKAATDAAKVLEYLGSRKIPVCLDVEDKCQQGLGIKLIEIINTYGDVITAAGLPFLIYTGPSFFNPYIKPYLNNLKYKVIWVARYYKGYTEMNISENPDTKYQPNFVGTEVIGWQYTSSGKVNGCNQRLDMSVLYQPIGNSSNNNTTVTAVLKDGVNALNIRSTDSTSGNKLGVYKKGDVITITGRSQATGWYLTPRGWISDKYVTII